MKDTLNHNALFSVTLLHKLLTKDTSFAIVLPICSFLRHIFQLIALLFPLPVPKV